MHSCDRSMTCSSSMVFSMDGVMKFLPSFRKASRTLTTVAISFPVSETSQRSGKINRPVINTVFDIHVTGLARMPGGLFASINHVAGWIAHNKVRFITVEYKHGRLLNAFRESGEPSAAIAAFGRHCAATKRCRASCRFIRISIS